jgi:hypothetical protein
VVEADNNATPLNMSERNVDLQVSYKWLSVGSLFAETERFMIAIQDEVIATKNYRKFILRDSQLPDDKCRKCNAASATIQHILGGCGVLSQTEYKARHDTMGKIIHRAS